MQTFTVPVVPSRARFRPRTALVASADSSFRRRLADALSGLRWQVREVNSGAQALAEAEEALPEAMVVDAWLPDLDMSEFLSDFSRSFPGVELVTVAETGTGAGPHGPHRQELLYALRQSEETDTASWNAAPTLRGVREAASGPGAGHGAAEPLDRLLASSAMVDRLEFGKSTARKIHGPRSSLAPAEGGTQQLAELVGDAPCMLEISRRVRLVAPRKTPVLIEGPTGSGKELVAKALHRLSTRNRKSFVAINCAAIPESLLEAELFGHTRGAFTGAVQGRSGRIEAADGGTLFLDEIGEMPLEVQAKLLRFVECGELQRVGDNETVKVDVRIIAATHQPLGQLARDGGFRSDLYYRLAVFLIRTPALAEHGEDLPLLVNHFLRQLGQEMPVKRIDAGAMAKLAAYDWPGNVRELEHVLERAAILADDGAVLTAREIDFGLAVN